MPSLFIFFTLFFLLALPWFCGWDSQPASLITSHFLPTWTYDHSWLSVLTFLLAWQSSYSCVISLYPPPLWAGDLSFEAHCIIKDSISFIKHLIYITELKYYQLHRWCKGTPKGGDMNHFVVHVREHDECEFMRGKIYHWLITWIFRFKTMKIKYVVCWTWRRKEGR